MKHIAICALALGLAGCSTTATPRDIELTNEGILFGIEACERHAIDGIPLDQAVTEGARGRKHERYTSGVPGSALQVPSWKLNGLVWAGLNAQGSCDVFALSGSGPAARDLVVSTHLGMSSRRWSRMRVVAAPEGEIRDAVCTADRVGEDKSVGVVITSRLDAAVTMKRTFVATVLKTDAESCTSRQIP
jgi:hypothetical protein